MRFKDKYYKKQKRDYEDILLVKEEDRRILSNVPDKYGVRNRIDRRGKKVLERNKDKETAFIEGNRAGIRYITEIDVKVKCKNSKEEKIFIVKSCDISTTGMLIRLKDKTQLEAIEKSEDLKLQFRILPG
ncbi:hypothetical protein [Clostridium sp.]|uniref:hypothetical protein n=1 Tax=Clostridium sp. TaxID=1506 RepID=UPI0029130705|nr:hypothetical protein [Clostridium sp.]MDU5105847.1 hypothetical protein [Clostridium sp.]